MALSKFCIDVRASNLFILRQVKKKKVLLISKQLLIIFESQLQVSSTSSVFTE